MPLKDITGQQFNMLLVKSFYDTVKGTARWYCLCSCGNTTIAYGTHLRAGTTKSCGCLHKTNTSKASTKHGWHGTRTYESWQNMIRRCVPGSRYYNRGIRVCNEWSSSFNKFLEDMGERPEGNYSLERNNPFGNYCVENCRWLPKSQNTIDTYRNKMTKRGQAKLDVFVRD